jgi:hypothetical protein
VKSEARQDETRGLLSVASKKVEMVRLGIRALIARISGKQRPASTPPNPIMVYSYPPPFETGKLNVSDIHSLQSVLSICTFFGLCLTWEDSYEVSGNRDGTPGAFHDSPAVPATVSESSLIVLMKRRIVIFLHGEVISCTIHSK